MGKNRDLFQILAIVIIGMFIPFVISISVVFQVDLLSMSGWWKVFSIFGIFLLVFGGELLCVFAYFHITNTLAEKKIEKENQRRKKNNKL